MGRLTALAAGLGMCLVGTATTSATLGAGDTAELALAMHGHIAPHCAFALDSDTLSLDLDGARGHGDVAFDLDCNVPLAFTVETDNGALVHEAEDRLGTVAGFATRLPYTLDIDVAAPGAQPMSWQSTHTADTPQTRHLGTVPFDAGGRVRLSWTSDTPLVAGRYSDVIRIRVAGDGLANGHW